MNHLPARWRRTLQKRRRVAHVLHLERLETRQLLTTTDNIYIVTNTNDSGAGSLRDAITWANAHPNDSPSTPDIIDFDIQPQDPNDLSQVATQQVIQPLTPLPAITDPVTIDGYTEWGASINQTLAGFEEQETDVAVLMVRIDGSLAQPDPSNPDGPINGLTVDVPELHDRRPEHHRLHGGRGDRAQPWPDQQQRRDRRFDLGKLHRHRYLRPVHLQLHHFRRQPPGQRRRDRHQQLEQPHRGDLATGKERHPGKQWRRRRSVRRPGERQRDRGRLHPRQR